MKLSCFVFFFFFFGKNIYKWLQSWHMCSKLPLKRFWLAADSLRLERVRKSLHLSSSFILHNHGQFNNAKHRRSTTAAVHSTHAVFWSWWVCVRNRPKVNLFLVAETFPLHQSLQIPSMLAVRLKYGTFGCHTTLWCHWFSCVLKPESGEWHARSAADGKIFCEYSL